MSVVCLKPKKNDPGLWPRGVWQSAIDGRYRRVPVLHLAYVWWLHREGRLSRLALRVWFACHEMAERRAFLGAKAVRAYGLPELRRLVGGGGSGTGGGAEAESSGGGGYADLSRALRELAREGVLQLDEGAIRFACPVEGAFAVRPPSFEAMLADIANHRRYIPVPRRLLRALAGGFSRAVTATILAHLMRCLYWQRSHGACRIDGRCKASWIVRVFGVSERAVVDARQRLVALGWLSMLPVDQWALNKWGARAVVNLGWCRDLPREGVPAPDTHPPAAAVGEARAPESAPPNRGIAARSAPPCTKQDSSPQTEKRNNRTPARRGGPAVVSLKEPDGEESGPPPKLTDLAASDLSRTARLLQLHEQAVRQGSSQAGEWGRLQFVSLAERALARGQDPVRLFRWLLKHQRFDFITQADEDQAQLRLKRHFYGDVPPKERLRSRPRRPADAPPAVPQLSRAAILVQACRQIAEQKRLPGDPFALAERCYGTTRETWDHGVQELEDAACITSAGYAIRWVDGEPESVDLVNEEAV